MLILEEVMNLFYSKIILLHIVQHQSKAIESEIQPFIKFVNTLKGLWSGFVNYFDTKLTNGILYNLYI